MRQMPGNCCCDLTVGLTGGPAGHRCPLRLFQSLQPASCRASLFQPCPSGYTEGSKDHTVVLWVEPRQSRTFSKGTLLRSKNQVRMAS